MSGMVGTNQVAQVAFIVKDIEKSKAAFANFLGVPVPSHFWGGEYEITKVEYKGKPAPKAKCQMAFFDVGPNLQIELIQPNGETSVWQDFLDEHGEGIQHIAFHLKNMDEKIAVCAANGMPLLQKGNYGDGGGRYAYLDGTKDLHCVIELLESFSE